MRSSVSALLKAMRTTSFVRRVRQALRRDGAQVVVDKAGGSLISLMTVSVSRPVQRVLVVAQDDEAAHRLLTDIRSITEGGRGFFFPGPDVLDDVVLPLRRTQVQARLRALNALQCESNAPIVVTTPSGLASWTASPKSFSAARRVVTRGDQIDRDQFISELVKAGYRRGPAVMLPGELSVRGGIVDVYSPTSYQPVRMEFWGDHVDALRSYDPSTQRSTHELNEFIIVPPLEVIMNDDSHDLLAHAELDGEDEALRRRLLSGEHPEGLERLFRLLPMTRGRLVDYLRAGDLMISSLSVLATKRWRTIVNQVSGHGHFDHAYDTPSSVLFLNGHERSNESIASGWRPLDRFGRDVGRFDSWLRERQNGRLTTFVALPKEGELQRLDEILKERGRSRPSMIRAELHGGFDLVDDGFALVTAPNLWEEDTIKGDPGFPEDENQRIDFTDWTELEEGCLVVHVDHGVGKFCGLTDLLIDGVRQEFINLEYARGDRLFVPIGQLDRVQRFIGVEGGAAPRLNRLSGTRWQQVKSRIRSSVRLVARDLLDLYARREETAGRSFSEDTVWQREMEDSFPFDETRDQIRSLAEVKRDMHKTRAMDRLICGDVGYGKTEVAIRAVFKAVQDGAQVAVLVPTTILAQQHYQTFSARLGPFPVRIAVISRLKSASEQRQILRATQKGEIDVLIGTHRLLSKDVRFKDLGLLVIDEEQRFGVRHKERIKALKHTVDVITLSATPIPRTLNLAMSGVRDISVINTSPRGRLPIVTVVTEFDERLVRGAIKKELERGGQVYYVNNRIEKQGVTIDRVKRLVPEARVRAGHGRMERVGLERLMTDFFNRDYDVLVSTTIIESGLDIPNVNTIIIEDSHRLGLSQLYQLRGRVGRTTRQAYAYLLYPERKILPEIAFKRLKALEEFTDLGSGFKIAMRDLEIRGAGNLLGAEQHGFVQSIGFELYTRLLRDAVAELKDGQDVFDRDPCRVELQVDSYIPEDYITDGELKLLYYRKLAEVRSLPELDDLLSEMVDRFGPLPERLCSLVRLVKIKLRGTYLGISVIRQVRQDVIVHFHDSRAPDGTMAEWLSSRFGGDIQFLSPPDIGFRVDLRGLRNQAILDLLDELLWSDGFGRGLTD